jgi:hypothetical protein
MIVPLPAAAPPPPAHIAAAVARPAAIVRAPAAPEGIRQVSLPRGTVVPNPRTHAGLRAGSEPAASFHPQGPSLASYSRSAETGLAAPLGAAGEAPQSEAPKQPPSGYRPANFYGTAVPWGPYWNRFNGPIVGNPHRWPWWGWNYGTPWQPSAVYWGGGFWGPFALSGLSGLIPYGYYQYDESQLFYPSYATAADTPGSLLLQDYGLQQTQCGQANLVVVWGPRNSVICAYPNNRVGAGNYRVDLETLDLVSGT